MTEQTEQAKAKAAETYNAAADHFDDQPLAFWERIGRRTVERLGLPAGSSVLDVACGTGASALPAAEIVGPTGSVIGADLAEHMLELGRAKARARGLNNITFLTGDMTALEYPDGHFDAVVCVFGVFFVPDMEGLVKELWRVVKPGGKLAITTWGPDIFEPMYTRFREAIRDVRPDLYSAFNPWDRITTIPQVEQLLRDGGVPNPVVEAEDSVQPLAAPEDWWTVAIGSGLRGTIDVMEAGEAERIRADNESWAREHSVASIGTNTIYAVGTK